MAFNSLNFIALPYREGLTHGQPEKLVKIERAIERSAWPQLRRPAFNQNVGSRRSCIAQEKRSRRMTLALANPGNHTHGFVAASFILPT